MRAVWPSALKSPAAGARIKPKPHMRYAVSSWRYAVVIHQTGILAATSQRNAQRTVTEGVTDDTNRQEMLRVAENYEKLAKRAEARYTAEILCDFCTKPIFELSPPATIQGEVHYVSIGEERRITSSAGRIAVPATS
jgi:hypothetical protein